MKYNSSKFKNEKITSINITPESQSQIDSLSKLLESNFINLVEFSLNIKVEIKTENHSIVFDYEMSEWEMNQSGWEDSFLCENQNKLDLDVLK